MPLRTIQSPGVEIREIDKSQFAPSIVGTYCLVQGFADKGVDLDPLEIASNSDLEANFGLPTNEAERYFYYSCAEVIRQGGNLVAAKLPYNSVMCNNYKYLGLTIDTANTISGAYNAPAVYGPSGFLSGALAGGILTVTHNLHNTTRTTAIVTNMSGGVVTPVAVTWPTEDTAAINLSSLTAVMTGTWTVEIDLAVGGGNDTIYNDVRCLTGLGFTKAASAALDQSTLSNNLPTSAYALIEAGAEWDETGIPAEIVDFHFILVNDSKNRITGPDANEGIFVSIVDPVHALRVQRMLASPEDSDPMDLITGIDATSGTNIVSGEIGESLTGIFTGSSFSETVMRQFPSMQFLNGGDTIDSFYAQHVGIVVCRAYGDQNNEGKLNFSTIEAFAGSIHRDKRDPATGQSIFICDLVNARSEYITMFENPKLKPTTPGYVVELPDEADTSIVLFRDRSDLTLMGFTEDESKKWIVSTGVVTNMKKVFEKLSNIDEIQIDVVVDAGLTTITEFCDTGTTTGCLFDPVNDVDDAAINSSTDVEQWRNVCDEFIAFCKDIRKDCMCILDVPRNLVLDANLKWVRKTEPDNTFSNTIGKRLRYCTGLNTSYAAMYADWMKMIDDYTGVAFWMPPSCKAAGIYIRTDRVANMWDAPAGLNRGIIDGIVDLAFNPNIKEADQLYTKSFNYAKRYPLDGFILEGQKTTQAKPSAFDRVNVRRLFLRLERLVYQVARYFVYEPNNIFTRRLLVAVITPIFQSVKAAGGLYDYRIECSELNNTAEVIDHNELKVAILLKPVRTAEFILVDFVATRTDANFQEILEQIV